MIKGLETIVQERQNFRTEIAKIFIEDGRYKINYDAAKQHKGIMPFIYVSTINFKENYSDREREGIIERMELRKKDVYSTIDKRVDTLIKNGKALDLYLEGIIKPIISWKEKEIQKHLIKRLVRHLKKPLIEITAEDFCNAGLRELLCVYFKSSPYYALKEAGYKILPWKMRKVPKKFFDERENRIKAVRWLVKKSGKQLTEIIHTDFRLAGLMGLFIEYFNGSPYKALIEAGYKIQPWEMVRIPEHWFDKKQNRIKATKWLVKKSGKKPNEITEKDFNLVGFWGLLDHSGGSYKALKEAGYEVLPRAFSSNITDRIFWIKQNRVKAVRELVKKSGKQPTEIKRNDFLAAGLGGLIQCYFSGSPYKALIEAGYKILPWEMITTPKHILDKKKNRIKAIKWLVKKSGKKPNEITRNDFYAMRLGGLLQGYFNGRTYKALIEAGYNLEPWEMKSAPKDFWPKKENRVYVTKRLVRILNKPIAEINKKDFENAGLGGLISYCEGSSFRALKEAGYVKSPSEMKYGYLIRN